MAFNVDVNNLDRRRIHWIGRIGSRSRRNHERNFNGQYCICFGCASKSVAMMIVLMATILHAMLSAAMFRRSKRHRDCKNNMNTCPQCRRPSSCLLSSEMVGCWFFPLGRRRTCHQSVCDRLVIIDNSALCNLVCVKSSKVSYSNSQCGLVLGLLKNGGSIFRNGSEFSLCYWLFPSGLCNNTYFSSVWFRQKRWLILDLWKYTI